MTDRPKKWVIGILAVGCLQAFIACEPQPAEPPQTKSKTPDSGVIVVRVGGDKDDNAKADPAWDLPAAAPKLKSSASKAF
jgi:hypothetical protein